MFPELLPELLSTLSAYLVADVREQARSPDPPEAPRQPALILGIRRSAFRVGRVSPARHANKTRNGALTQAPIATDASQGVGQPRRRAKGSGGFESRPIRCIA